MATNSEALPCTSIFGPAKGLEIIELIERTTGEACPCRQGRPCPLVARPFLGPSTI